MNNHFLKEGFSSYYVIKREQEYLYEERILSDQKCKAVLSFDIRRVDEERYYYFHISGYIPLKQKMDDKKNSVNEYKEVYRKILEAVHEVEDYLLPPEGILLESETIFWDDQNRKIKFCYLPGREKDLMQQLLDLTEEFLELINYEDKKLVEYLYGVHELISKGRIPLFEEDPAEEAEEEQVMYKSEYGENAMWEYEQEEQPFFREEAEVRQSGRWYMELAVSALISIGLVFLTGYQLFAVYEFGWTSMRIKMVVVFCATFIGNTIYLIKKAKIKTVPEKFTTILTEEETIDKIGES